MAVNSRSAGKPELMGSRSCREPSVPSSQLLPVFRVNRQGLNPRCSRQTHKSALVGSILEHEILILGITSSGAAAAAIVLQNPFSDSNAVLLFPLDIKVITMFT
jgi:hypothetical protein